MFRIRRIYDDIIPVNRSALDQVKEILKNRFPGIDRQEIESLGNKLVNPLKYTFRTFLFVAEDIRRRVLGFALMRHEPQLQFLFLEFLAVSGSLTRGGIGGALYERVRQEGIELGVQGLLFECLPDDPKACPDPVVLKDNKARLRFYERYGARPIVNTGYELPIKPGDTCMPHLVYDGLFAQKPPGMQWTRKAVRAILERKYGELCPPDYIKKVVDSFRQNPVQLRDHRYKKPPRASTVMEKSLKERILLVINDQHAIHHVRERGYVEAPVRIESISGGLAASGLFETVKPRKFPDRHVKAVHAPDLVDYLRRACELTAENRSLYPYVFPLRNKARPPRDPSVLPGYYCIDTFTPIHRNAYPAARRAVDCALTAASEMVEGRRFAYALLRPPGHHAERSSFGGFCYLNNNALAANYLSAHGKVAILDIDYHHGNGQQDIFYRRSDVLTVSIHGHPRFAYPYFCGFEDEPGEGPGEGFNLNLPLPEARNGKQYRQTLLRALNRIESFRPAFLVVALGLDTARRDPTGTWSLDSKDFEQNGRMIGELGLPTLVVQEGGYRTKTLGANALAFFTGLLAGAGAAGSSQRSSGRTGLPVTFRTEVRPDDPRRIREMVEATAMFNPAEVDVAEELPTETLARGPAAGYRFVFAEHKGRTIGYTCYGHIACTETSYDLYWIAVHPGYQGHGLGKKLTAETERLISEAGGTRVYVETSARPQYDGTRDFYLRCGYTLASVLDDFYAPSDGRATYVKVLAPSSSSSPSSSSPTASPTPSPPPSSTPLVPPASGPTHRTL